MKGNVVRTSHQDLTYLTGLLSKVAPSHSATQAQIPSLVKQARQTPVRYEPSQYGLQMREHQRYVCSLIETMIQQHISLSGSDQVQAKSPEMERLGFSQNIVQETSLSKKKNHKRMSSFYEEKPSFEDQLLESANEFIGELEQENNCFAPSPFQEALSLYLKQPEQTTEPQQTQEQEDRTDFQILPQDHFSPLEPETSPQQSLGVQSNSEQSLAVPTRSLTPPLGRTNRSLTSLYDRIQLSQAKKQARMAKLRQQLQAQQEEPSFHPQINPSKLSESFSERQLKYSVQRQARQQSQLLRDQQNRNIECPFKPAITSHGSQNSFQQRQSEYLQRKEKKLEQLRSEQALSHMPQINPVSQKLSKSKSQTKIVLPKYRLMADAEMTRLLRANKSYEQLGYVSFKD